MASVIVEVLTTIIFGIVLIYFKHCMYKLASNCNLWIVGTVNALKYVFNFEGHVRHRTKEALFDRLV